MRRVMSAGLAVMLAAVLGWQLFIQQDTERVSEPGPSPSLAAYARDVVLTTTDSDGQVAWRVNTPAARYYDDEDFWQLDSPRWRLSTADGPPWRGQAEHGRSWANETRARLQGDVVMTRQRPAGTLRLETRRIDLDIPARFAETDLPVKLVGPGYRINSIGAQAWLDEERIELIDTARGQYDAAPR